MSSVNLAEAKARLSELVERASSGDTVQILRRGKAVAQIAPIARVAKPIDLASLKALTDTMPMQSETAGSFIREMRDSDRY